MATWQRCCDDHLRVRLGPSDSSLEVKLRRLTISSEMIHAVACPWFHDIHIAGLSLSARRYTASIAPQDVGWSCPNIGLRWDVARKAQQPT